MHPVGRDLRGEVSDGAGAAVGAGSAVLGALQPVRGSMGDAGWGSELGGAPDWCGGHAGACDAREAGADDGYDPADAGWLVGSNAQR